MNDLSQKVLDILSGELSPITAKMIVEEKTKAVGKTPDTLTKADLDKLISAIMGPVLLFGGEAKAQSIKKKLEGLK